MANTFLQPNCLVTIANYSSISLPTLRCDFLEMVAFCNLLFSSLTITYSWEHFRSDPCMFYVSIILCSSLISNIYYACILGLGFLLTSFQPTRKSPSQFFSIRFATAYDSWPVWCRIPTTLCAAAPRFVYICGYMCLHAGAREHTVETSFLQPCTFMYKVGGSLSHLLRPCIQNDWSSKLM